MLFLNSDILIKSISKNHCDSILESIFSVIGESGLLVTPAFNYDFVKQVYFILINPLKGYFSNYLLRKKNVHRSLHPIFSFVALERMQKNVIKCIK